MNHFIKIPDAVFEEFRTRNQVVVDNIWKGNMGPNPNEEIDFQFRNMVSQLFKELPTEIETLLHASVGISGEAGELLDAVKKTWIYNKPLDVANAIEELGDALFYIEKILIMLNIDVSCVKLWNMYKLQHGPNARFKYGYTDQAAQARADKVGVETLNIGRPEGV